jgi:hypothetical protein
MVLCEVADCPNEASGRCSQDRYPCAKAYCVKHSRAVRGIIWCDVCWAQRIEAEHRQEIRGKKAEQEMLLILAASIVLGYDSMFLLELSMVGEFGLFTVFGGTAAS